MKKRIVFFAAQAFAVRFGQNHAEPITHSLNCIFVIHLTHADRLVTAHYSRRSACGIRCIDHTTTSLCCIFNPAIITARVGLKIGPNAAEFALNFATCIGPSRRVAAETNAIQEDAPASCFEQLKFFLLVRTEFARISIKISAEKKPACPATRRIAWWDFAMKQAAAALDSGSDASVAI